MEGQTFEEPLAELSEEEKSFLVCAAAVVLLALGACLRATSHHWSHVSTFCKKNFLNLINRPQNEESRWERRSLYMQVCLQKVILAEIYWRYSACWLIFLTLTRASRILTKDPVWISSFAAWGWVLLAFLIIVWTQVPCATQTWSLDFVCILWYLATGFYLSSWVIPVEQLLLMEFVLFVLVALPLCTFAKHYSVVFLCQGGLMAFVVACAVLEDLPRKRISSQHSVVVLNIVFLGVTLLVHFLSNSFLEQTVELRVREADSQTQRNATSSLLELTCDAVVHLDSELRVTSDARDALAAMLFRSPETLRGTKFTELIATDCQSRAEEMLKEAQAPAHAFHTQLVDGCSSRFRTEVFQVKYTKMNGQRCHLTDVKPLSRPSPDALAADALSVDPDVHSYEMGSLDLASRSDESSVQMPQQLLRPPPRRLTRVMLETGGG